MKTHLHSLQMNGRNIVTCNLAFIQVIYDTTLTKYIRGSFLQNSSQAFSLYVLISTEFDKKKEKKCDAE